MAVTLIVRAHGRHRGGVLGVACEDGRVFIRTQKTQHSGRVLDLGPAWFDGQPPFHLRARILTPVSVRTVAPLLRAAGARIAKGYGHWNRVALD